LPGLGMEIKNAGEPRLAGAMAHSGCGEHQIDCAGASWLATPVQLCNGQRSARLRRRCRSAHACQSSQSRGLDRRQRRGLLGTARSRSSRNQQLRRPSQRHRARAAPCDLCLAVSCRSSSGSPFRS
jgi:hypothetical protein